MTIALCKQTMDNVPCNHLQRLPLWYPNCFEAKCVTKRTKIERYHAAAFHVAHALPFFFPLLPHRCFCSVVLTLRYAMQTIEPLHRGLAYTTVSITGTIVYCTGCNNCFKHSYLAPALFLCRNPTRFRFENVLNSTRVSRRLAIPCEKHGWIQ